MRYGKGVVLDKTEILLQEITDAFGLPTRYIHSHNSIIYRKDYDNMVRLTIEVIKKLNKITVDSLTDK